jgi:hypothetical protein
MGEVMQAHWYPTADQGRFSPYLNRDPLRRGLSTPDPGRADDRAELDEFPYLHDLARLGGLLALPPWREPQSLRELVEDYRERLAGFVQLYRNGLGTVVALRTMVAAELPTDRDRPRAQRERSFSIEEFTPLRSRFEAFQGRGRPDAPVGPLMRWTFDNDGLAAASPTLYIAGLAAGERQDPTAAPLLERFTPDGELPGLGIGYSGTVAADDVLRLRPAYRSWLGRDGGLEMARSEPGDSGAGDPGSPDPGSPDSRSLDPGAAGPWAAVVGAPADVRVLYQSRDHWLWVAAGGTGDGAGGGDGGGAGSTGGLWRHDGGAWTQVLDADVHCLGERGQDLLIGGSDGLMTMGLYPQPGEEFTTAALASLVGVPVYAMAYDDSGRLWLGTEQGAGWLDGDDAFQLSPLRDSPVHAIHRDPQGLLYFGGALGLFQYRPGGDPPQGDWYWYRGGQASDPVPDWAPLEAVLPSAEQVFLPPVSSIHVGPDASLWIGTDNGVARYLARHQRGWAYDTVLEAYPELVVGPVHAIDEDQRGVVWFATDRGLLRYDGRDLQQYRAGADAWVSQGEAGLIYAGEADPVARGRWRFDRTLSRWQRFDAADADWVDFVGERQTTTEAPVRALLWTDSVVADLGGLDGSDFSPRERVPASELRLRCKPEESRIVAAGLPCLPRLPLGASTWRYLSMSAQVPPEVRPWWSHEGQLFPEHGGETPTPGRHKSSVGPASPPEVFAYRPAARVWFEWAARNSFSALVRLRRRDPGEAVHPEIIDRVWRGIERVRPAGVSVVLAIEETIVRGN